MIINNINENDQFGQSKCVCYRLVINDDDNDKCS